jgi:hypothetical protein
LVGSFFSYDTEPSDKAVTAEAGTMDRCPITAYFQTYSWIYLSVERKIKGELSQDSRSLAGFYVCFVGGLVL